MGQCRKIRVHGLLLLAYRLLRWPTIVTSRLPSSPAACFCPRGSRPFPLDFLLWGPFGHAATQVKFKPPRSKSASQHSSPPPPSPQDFRQQKHFRKTDCFDKERAREKTRFSVQKSTKKRPKTHVLNDRPAAAPSEPAANSRSPGTQPNQIASWAEHLPPKLTSERVSSLVETFKSNYPGELLDADTTPSIRLLSLVHEGLKPGRCPGSIAFHSS